MAEVRLIDANALKRDLIDNWAFYSVLMKNALDRQPTISPDSLRPKGRWSAIDASYWRWYPDGAHPVRRIKYRHDECGKVVSKKENFCPNCGADMTGG